MALHPFVGLRKWYIQSEVKGSWRDEATICMVLILTRTGGVKRVCAMRKERKTNSKISRDELYCNDLRSKNVVLFTLG